MVVVASSVDRLLLQVCTEYLIIRLLHFNRKAVVDAIMGLLQQVQSTSWRQRQLQQLRRWQLSESRVMNSQFNDFSTRSHVSLCACRMIRVMRWQVQQVSLQQSLVSVQDALVRDAVYHAIGLSTSLFKQYIDFSQWYSSELRPILAMPAGPNLLQHRVLCKRAIWLVGRFAPHAGEEMQQQVYAHSLDRHPSFARLLWNPVAMYFCRHALLSTYTSCRHGILSTYTSCRHGLLLHMWACARRSGEAVAFACGQVYGPLVQQLMCSDAVVAVQVPITQLKQHPAAQQHLLI